MQSESVIDRKKNFYNYNYIEVLYSAPYNGGRERFTEK